MKRKRIFTFVAMFSFLLSSCICVLAYTDNANLVKGNYKALAKINVQRGVPCFSDDIIKAYTNEKTNCPYVKAEIYTWNLGEKLYDRDVQNKVAFAYYRGGFNWGYNMYHHILDSKKKSIKSIMFAD